MPKSIAVIPIPASYSAGMSIARTLESLIQSRDLIKKESWIETVDAKASREP
jgi:hypothetical protein